MEASSLFYKAAPLNVNEKGLHPTLVLLHGRGADENDLLELASSFDHRLLIISVRAPYQFSYSGYTWFDLPEMDTPNIQQILESRDRLMRFLEDIQQRYPVDPQRIFLFGFSMGAMMSLLVSLSSPEKIKGVAAHSGLLLQHEQVHYQWEKIEHNSFFIAHGRYDSIVPVELGRQAHRLLTEAKANILYREYSIEHTISEESLNDVAAWLKRQI